MKVRFPWLQFALMCAGATLGVVGEQVGGQLGLTIAYVGLVASILSLATAVHALIEELRR